MVLIRGWFSNISSHGFRGFRGFLELLEFLRAACLQNEVAPEKLLNRYEKRFEKREKRSEKRS